MGVNAMIPTIKGDPVKMLSVAYRSSRELDTRWSYALQHAMRAQAVADGNVGHLLPSVGRSDATGRMAARKGRVVEFVVENPGCTHKEIRIGCSLGEHGVIQATMLLRGEGKIERRDEGQSARFWAAEGEA